MEHPLYSPDLSPADFWLFGYLTNALAGKHFTEVKGLSSAIYQALASIPDDEWSGAFDSWLDRMQRCIDNEGGYFERL